VIGVPQLCGYKNVFARDPSSGKSCLERLAYLTLIPVSLRTIEVPESSFQFASGRSYRHSWIWNQRAKAECRYMTASVVERHSLHPKIRRFRHWNTSALLFFSLHRRPGSENLIPAPEKGDKSVKGVSRGLSVYLFARS
jgi:hypothetical protein